MTAKELAIKVIMAYGRSPKDVAMELRAGMLEHASACEESIRGIIWDVKARGDEAVIHYERMYGWKGCSRERLMVSNEEIDSAIASLDREVISSLEFAYRELEMYHIRRAPKSTIEFGEDGSIYAELVHPIGSLAIYVPGGKAVYPSTVLHVGVPAKVAGVREVYIATPPDEHGAVHPSVLAAARLIGAKAVFRIGGAHALAAFAFGTESIPKVDMIAGPGGSYVVAAKRLLYGLVGIDLLPGPSEILVIADDSANANLVAMDMLAQSEHGEDSAAILVTPSERVLSEAHSALLKLLSESERREMMLKSLNAFGALILASSIDWALELCNEYAPEHVELHCADALALALKIRNAGAVFIGGTPAAYGDYAAGPSHVLPTLCAARFSSGLSVETFIKHVRCVRLGDGQLLEMGRHVMRLAHVEGLRMHARSVEERISKLKLLTLGGGVDEHSQER